MPHNPEKQLARIRQICDQFPGTLEKLSHDAPTFFAGGKKIFTMFVDDHHDDGRLAVWVPAPDGAQEILIEAAPKIYYKPPYVGPRGWIGIELHAIDDAALEEHIDEAWQMVAQKKLLKEYLATLEEYS